jgi:hypothetical protein
MKASTDTSKMAMFNREFFDSKEEFTYIGNGSLGGKAKGLSFIKDIISGNLSEASHPDFFVNIPRLTVITTSVFDSFMKLNNLYETALSDLPDDRIAHAFQLADLPAELVGDLRALIAKVHSPLAIRSSSLLEDAMFEPFAGIYSTKMIPNNQFDTDSRFRKLTEAIKLVYASTFFKKAKDYILATNNRIEDEKMAVIIQEIVGQRFSDRFYPNFAGVARSYNFYPTGKSKPEDGVVDLAVGLGKTIVDGGITWSYSPAQPKAQPPFGSINYLLKQTQKSFWTVNMGKPPAYDPLKETEYMFELGLQFAEEDGTLDLTASTYNAASDRVVPGTGTAGPRIINFAPMLALNMLPMNKLIRDILKICGDAVGSPVEIEFAVTYNNDNPSPARFGFLQVRPMVVSNEEVEITEDELNSDRILVSSKFVLGNGVNDSINDVVFVKPDKFDAKYTSKMAAELEIINKEITKKKIPYMLIGFGRWGSSDPWLGIPVNWGQISGAKVIVESMLPNMNVDLSQGSHFFHNITSFRILYFSLPYGKKPEIEWNWLNKCETVNETNFIKHIRVPSPLLIKVDGRSCRGIILK